MHKSFPCAAGALLACTLPVSMMPATAATDPVIVTATRTAQLADEVLAPVIVITSEEIARSQATDVADLLRFHAGLELGRNGGPGQLTSLFLRGTNSNHTLVMIDGVRINPGTIGGAALQNLDPVLIERIEIVKGPRSSLYGSDAIGGVVNIITRRARTGTDVDVSVGGGSFDTRKASAGVRHAGNGVRAGLEVSAQATDGYPPHTDSGLDRGHDNTSVSAYVGRRFSAFDVELSYFRAHGNTEYFFFGPLDQDFLNSAAALTLGFEPTASWASRVQLSQARDEIDQKQSPDFAHTDRRMLDWQNDLQLGASHLLTAGIWLMRDKTSALVFGGGFGEETDTKAVYLQDSIGIGAHSLLFAARYSDYDSFGSQTTWDAGYGYRLSDATRFVLSAGTAFRAPDSTERFGFGGDPNLRPEKSRNIEIGVRHRLSATQRFSLNLFQNDVEDLVWMECNDDFSVCQLENVREARIRGVEAGYDYRSGPWRAGIEAIVQDPLNRSTSEPLPRRAKRSVTASLGYDGGRYQLGADLLASSERRDSDFSTTRLAGYGLVNLTAALSLAQDWTLRARIENLLDKEYELAGGYRPPERSYFVQLAWRYQRGGDPS